MARDAERRQFWEAIAAGRSIECELIERTSLRSFTHARREVFEYMEGWYNPHRRHSALGYESPINYEQARQLAA